MFLGQAPVTDGMRSALAMLRRRVFAASLMTLALAWLANHPAAAATDRPIDDFFGDYSGETVVDTGDGISRRQLRVAIAPADKGFSLEWQTLSEKDDGRVKDSTHRVEFKQTKRPGIFVSVVRKDVFGNRRPLDPLSGGTFMWSSISGDSLFTYAMLISDDGKVDLQVYQRTLTEGGIDLRFYRFREGWLQKAITASLFRD